MRIALISSPMLLCPPHGKVPYGGSEMVVWDLACALTEFGHMVVLFAPTGSQIPSNGFLVETPEPALKVQCDWLGAEQNMFDVYSKHVTDDFDVVHGHGWFGLEFMLRHDNVWHTHHGGLNTSWFNQLRTQAKLPIRIIAISKFMKHVYEEQGYRDECKHFCYNGVNMSKYHFSSKHDSGRLLFVGRIDSFKRPDLAIDAAKKLGMGLDIVGGTFVQDEGYLNKIRGLCDGTHIKLYENAPHELKIRLMQSAKCLLFLGAMGEPFGLVPVEAMACGCPVVSFNDGAIEEVVQEGGIVCDVYDKKFCNGQLSYGLKEELLAALTKAVGRIDTISPQECRKNAEKFRRENMAENYLKIYQEQRH